MPVNTFLQGSGIVADIVYAASDSRSHQRASAWYTSDDDVGPQIPFMLDGVAHHHCSRYLIPGTVAIHRTATSLTAAHEFSHAISSYTNGKVVDLYIDNSQALNCKRPQPPVPPTFAIYDGTSIQSDLVRHPMGYPAEWQSYHCDLSSPHSPAMMDNYWLGTPPESCENDLITRRFIQERVLAKMGR